VCSCSNSTPALNSSHHFHHDTLRIYSTQFKQMLNDLEDVGGNIDMLLHQGKRGCLSKCVAYPKQDLVTFVKTQHTLLFVIYGRGQPELYDWNFLDRMVFVVIILLWSAMANR
jgi:hypothetical protein